MRLPDTKITKPNNYTKIAPALTNYHWKFGRVAPKVIVMMIPIAQTITVRVTSPIERAKALMYFVTVTPQMLNVAIEKIPKITKNNKTPFDATSEKYCSGLSKNGMPALLNTQA